MGTGNGGLFLSGTSMASPHTAGEALLVKQAHPTWGGPLGDASQYWKDAIVNTANSSLVASYAIRNAGAGEIDAYNATHTRCVADGSPAGTSSLSFGVARSPGHYTATQTITLHNFSSSACDFQMSVTHQQGVKHSVRVFSGNSNAPLKIRVPAHGTATVSVQLDVLKTDAADPVKSFNDCWSGPSCHYDDAAGLIHFRAINGSNRGIALNVPYYVVPTLVSNVKIDGISSAALAGGATDGNVVLRNPNGGIGYADWFSWGGSSPVVGGIGSADLLNVGVQSFPDGSNTADATSFVEFALNTTQSWSNPAQNFAEIDIDVNSDNVPDYAVLSEDVGRRTAGSANGQAAVTVFNLHTGAFVIHYLTGAMFNGTTMELLARFSDLCTAGAPCVSTAFPIKYVTFMTDRNGGQDAIGSEDPITGNITSAAAGFDVFAPSLSTFHGSSDTIHRNAVVPDPTTIDAAAWAANPQLGILVISQNNQNTVGEALTFALSF